MSGGKLKRIENNIVKHEKYFKGSPEITFFKKVYKKTSVFNITTIEQELLGNMDFGNILNCVLNKSGDLLKTIYLEIILPDLEKPYNCKWYGYTNNIGCSIIKSITFKINNQIIEKIYGEWIDIYYQINNININDMVKQYNSDYSLRNKNNNIDYKQRKVYIPIPFFFTKDSGLALPLIALNNSIISIDIELTKLNEIIKIDNFNELNNIKQKYDEKLICKLFTEIIFLDKYEKKIFINKNIEYLIEQTQFNNNDFFYKTDLYKNVELDFRYIIKQLIWVIVVDNKNLDNILEQDHNNITKYTTQYSNYEDTFDTLQIYFNNIEIIDESALYFRKVQSNIYHKNISNKYIYSYSFSINPLSYQPSGYVNFSNINQILLKFKFKDYKLNISGSSTNGIIKIFAVNYNILKIASGMASLLYTI
jgi:hypothetical protein